MDYEHLVKQGIPTNANMDETEDEEVKRNCFGRKHFDSESEYDDSTDDESDDDCSRESCRTIPIKFVSYTQHGTNVHKPTPLAFGVKCLPETPSSISRGDDSNAPQNHPPPHHRKRIIHTECLFTDDDDCSDVSEEQSLSANSNLSAGQDSDCDSVDASDATDSDSESEASDEDTCQEDLALYREEDAQESDGEQLDDSSITEDDNSESSVVDEQKSQDNETETDCDADIDDSDEEDESEEKEQQGKVIFDWDQEILNGDKADLVANVSGSACEDSLSAEEIENMIEREEETGDICFSDAATDHEDNDDDNSTQIEDEDMMECLDAIGDETTSIRPSPLKRDYSFQKSIGVTPEHGLPLRKKICRQLSRNAFLYMPALREGGTADLKLSQRNSSQLSVSTDEEDVDNQLAEELSEEIANEKPRSTTPVPLLTPPGTPIRQTNFSQVEVCEWPSNLAVDNAMTAAIELRSLSPSSLMKLEEENPSQEDLTTPTYPRRRIRSVSEVSTTGLTPLMSSFKMMPQLKY